MDFCLQISGDHDSLSVCDRLIFPIMEPQKLNDSFTLQCQNEEFSARRESIFGNLPIVELAHKEIPALSSSTCDIVIDEENSKNDDVTIYKGEESMFKRPMPKLKKSSYPPRRQHHLNRTNTPDHKKNPHKWVKYNLAATSDVTDKSNTAAALSFLRDLEDRKRKLEDVDEPADTSGKIVFKKPKTFEGRSEKGKTYRDGKLVMPAFEFGSGSKKQKESRRKLKASIEGSSQTTKIQSCLSHLEEEDGEEDHNTDDKNG